MKPFPVPGSRKRLTLLLVLIVLLPALFYSAYEINSLSASEELMGEIYRRQLDAILFSVNQYAWDLVSSWTGGLMGIAVPLPGPRTGRLEVGLKEMLDRLRPVQALFVCDTMLQDWTLVRREGTDTAEAIGDDEIRSALRNNPETTARLLRFRRAEYRKIEPLDVAAARGGTPRAALLFVLDRADGSPAIGGFVLNEEAFVRDLLAAKLREVSGEEFVLAVLASGRDTPVVSTGEIRAAEITQKRKLWILPSYALGIRLKGTSVEELLRERFRRNLILILLLDAVLLAGVWLVYRTVRKEMELVRLKSDFVSNVSHELRTPLSLIRMFAETLEMGRLKEERKKQEYYGTILRETERLTRLVNNILNFSRMEAGRKEYHLRSVDLNAVVSAVLETYGSHLQSEGIQPRTELDPALPRVRADEEALTEALINVIDNAVKYSPAEKHLALRTGTGEGMAFVEVEDHGVGIAPEHQARIFEMFYRISEGRVHNARGSGLGLTLVKHIMDAHAGKVTVRSAPGEGSVFRLAVPLA